jgi:hypothetical protein
MKFTTENHPFRDTFVAIVPHAGLWLRVHGHGNDERFARLFRATWFRIPVVYRRRMVDYWSRADDSFRRLVGVPRPLRKGEMAPHHAALVEQLAHLPARVRASILPSLICPRIELLHGWVGGWEADILDPPNRRRPLPAAHPEGHAARALGVTYATGHLLRFRAGVVDRMPDDVVQDLVAHELGHVFFWATGRYAAAETAEGERDQGAEEAEVDELAAAQWGFGVNSIDDWCVEVGLSRTLNFESLDALVEYERTHGTLRLAHRRPK